MPQSKLVGLLFDAWDDLDRATDGLDAAQAAAGMAGGSSFAWTVGHLASYVDFWINVKFAGREPHALISEDRFRFGAAGQAEDWDAIRQAALAVRADARDHLAPLTDADLDRGIPYQGMHQRHQGKVVTLRYYVMRSIAHHYFHIGEIASKRDQMGHQVGDYPGPMPASF